MSTTQPQPADRLDLTLRHGWEMHGAVNRRAVSPSTPRPTSRVEHRMDHLAANLSAIGGGFGHHATLAPLTSFLCLSGRVEGEVVLIDTASGCVVARCAVAPSLHRAA